MDFTGAIAETRELMETEVAPKVPGLSIAVAAGGTLVWSEVFGLADLAAKQPVTTATRFRIGSVSKPLTAAGLALLVERGQLDLDAPVQEYLPNFPVKDGVLTSRLLAGHLTGIRNYRGTEAVSSTPCPNLRSGLRTFENDPLEAPPGARFSYSSYNYNLLGAVMEAAAKMDFLTYMDESVIKPLGLTGTVPDRAGVADPQRAQFYEIEASGKFLVPPLVDLSFVWPAGGYLSTAEDLVRFGLAMSRPGFLKPESLKLLFTPQKTSAGTPTNYGIGWFVNGPVVSHGGDSIGGLAVLLLHPPSRTVVAFASNGGQGLLVNGLRRGRVPKEAERHLVKKEALAVKIAGAFVRLFKKPGPTG